MFYCIGQPRTSFPIGLVKTESETLDQLRLIGVVLVPCHTWKCVPTTISGRVDISKVPRCHLLCHMSSQ